MPFAAALSTAASTERALEEVCIQARERLPDPPELALLFFSPHHAEADAALAGVASRVQARCLIGCVGEAVIGNDQEIEQRPAISLWLGKWTRPIQVEPFHLTSEQTSEGESLMGWPDGILSADPNEAVLLTLGDPLSFPVDAFLAQVNADYPGLRVLGGMASGTFGQGVSPLVSHDRVVKGGAVGVLLQGAIGLRGIVSQGCRPIGRPLVITRGQENIIAELGGRPPLALLQQLWQELNDRDRQLFQRGLHLGLVINEYQADFQRGDFLVRNVLGLERESGALAIADHIRVGQTVQFHIRDAASADEDLHALLQLDLQAHERPPAGALVFSCNGRGTRLFQEPNHDARVIRSEAGPIPLAGLFAAGELGPIGGRNFIHGFTASVALFEE
jgi:small ligand-binding sensory domain FIST